MNHHRGENNLDTHRLDPDLFGHRRRFRAWIFTPVLSRYRFAYPVFEETTATAIEACEAAWEFYGGVFRVLIPDNTKTIVQTADPLEPKLTAAFLEYAQARGFVIDTTRVRSPRDKARVERSVPSVRDDCFGGEHISDLKHARARSLHWSTSEYGMRRHSSTQRLPREHFEAVEKSALLAPPTSPYDVPVWAEPKVARDQHAQVARALYSLPTLYVGKTLRARADRSIVRFYSGSTLVKTHPRVPPGQRSIDPNDFPREKSAYAFRDITYLAQQAATHGPHVGRFAQALLAGPLPWTRMRQVYALLALAKKFGDARLNQACSTALSAEMLSVHKLRRLLELATPPDPASVPRPTPAARFLRPSSLYALPIGPDAAGTQTQGVKP